MPLIKNPEEKRLAIAVLGATPAARSLEMLVASAAEADTAEDACAALVKFAGHATVAKDQRQKALQTAVEKSKNDETKKQAQELLGKS